MPLYVPIKDLRSTAALDEIVSSNSTPAIVAKNGCGSMVVMSIEQFERLNGSVEAALDAADIQAATTNLRYTHNELFGSIRKGLHDERASRHLGPRSVK